jgi:hypothetical protein
MHGNAREQCLYICAPDALPRELTGHHLPIEKRYRNEIVQVVISILTGERARHVMLSLADERAGSVEYVDIDSLDLI